MNKTFMQLDVVWDKVVIVRNDAKIYVYKNWVIYN